ncbi:MAG: type IV pilus secretin PilQ [Desulfobacterales bacterium]|nr:type IV pilus secretin PilQ [Desulfobacterales bacterium]
MYSHEEKSRSIRLISMVIGIFMVLAGCSTTPSHQGAEEQKAQEQKIQEQKEAAGPVTRIEAVNIPGSGQIEIQSSGEMDFTSVKQIDPPGVIFYFPQTRLGDIRTSYQPRSEIMRSVNLSSSKDQKNVRMEVELAENLPYRVNKQGGIFMVEFDDTAAEASDRAAADIESAGAAQKEIKREKAEEKQTGQIQSEKYAGPATIEDIGFETLKDGKSVISIGTSRPAKYDITKTAEKRLSLSLPDSSLPGHMDRRPLITTRFDSAVDRVIPYEAPTAKDAVKMIIELREAVPYWVERSDGQIEIHFEASTIGPRPYAKADMPDWQRVLEEEITRKVVKETGPEEPAGAKARRAAEAEKTKWLFEKEEYTGEKIALDFYETDIKNVFRILQQVSGKNYAIDPDVGGKVTISMEKPVPWDQVLHLILQQNKLGMVEQDGIIRIATQKTLREEEQARQQRIEAYKKRIEQQKTLEPLITEYIPVNYANAKSEVLPHVKDTLSDRGKITVDSRNNQIIITDTRERIAKAREIIDQIDQVTPQVVIEARIVEVNEDYTREFGMQFSARRNGVTSSSLGGIYGHNVSMNYSADTANSIGLWFENIGTPLTLDAKLTALERSNDVKIISAPKIVTLDNKKATITQGLEYPYQTVEDDNVQIEFKDIDLTLEVTPHVTPDRRIALKIYLTKNEIHDVTISPPALSTNEAETELLVNDGSTIVIGGIKKSTITEGEDGFPVLKDIPILGYLFKTKTNQNTRRELLIFMTPRIVQLEQRKMMSASGN